MLGAFFVYVLMVCVFFFVWGRLLLSLFLGFWFFVVNFFLEVLGLYEFLSK